MAERLFQRATSTSNGYVISPAPNHYKNLVADTFTFSANGNSITLAAGAAAFSYVTPARFATALPGATGNVVGSFRAFVGFQTTNPTNVFTKFRVHRATASGTVVTIVNTSEWSAERRTDRTTQRWELHLDQVDVGTWASTDLVVFETEYRNAGTASITIAPVGGSGYQNIFYTPFTTNAAFGYTSTRIVGQRPTNYSFGGVNGTSRYLEPTTSTIANSGTIAGRRDNGSVAGVSTSTGTATGTKSGQDFSGTVSGVSTSIGTIAGSAGFTGSTAGSSTSLGTVAAGQQGFTGSTTGQSSTSGFVSGNVGLSGLVNGESISTGTAQGSPTPPSPDRRPSGIPMRRRIPYPIKPIHASGTTRPIRIYSVGYMLGNAGHQGTVINTIQVVGHAIGVLGYGGTSAMGVFRSSGKLKKPMHIRSAFDIDELFVMGEI